MRNEVIVSIEAGQDFRISTEGLSPMALDDARRWLDQQFVQLECEPLRATGKLLTADRVLCVAQAAGVQKFNDATWANDFARASSAALGKAFVRVDVRAMAVTY